MLFAAAVALRHSMTHFPLDKPFVQSLCLHDPVHSIRRACTKNSLRMAALTFTERTIPRAHIYSSKVLGFALCQLSKMTNCFQMPSGEVDCTMKKHSNCVNVGYHFYAGRTSYRSYRPGCKGGTIRNVGPGIMLTNTGVDTYVHMKGRSTCTYENHGLECKIPPNAPQFMINMEGKFCEDATMIF